MKVQFARAFVVAATLAGSVTTAEAHIIASRLGDFYTGAVHPLTELQDLVLWLAMGVLAGSLGAARGRWLVLVFPLGLLAGLVLDLSFGLVSVRPAADAAMILVLGLLLAAAATRIPTALLCALAFGLAVMHGAANAADLAPETNRLLFAAGLACAGYAAITLIMALTLTFRPDAGPSIEWRGIAIRAFGGWIAAIGLMMVGFALAS